LIINRESITQTKTENFLKIEENQWKSV
jgi:hypothetical protein